MIPYGKHFVDEEDIEAVVDILRHGYLTQGPMIDQFEAAVAEYVGAKYAVAVSSCTAALHLGALAAGIGPGKTLVTSPITFLATSNAALYCGGDVDFCDIDPATINMSPHQLEKTLHTNRNVGVVAPVHFGGLPADMPAISRLANGANALVMEDAAHALGGTYHDGQKIGCGAYSDLTAFSFHPVKAVAAGEGGMLTTNDESLHRELLRLRSHGVNKLDDPFILTDQSMTGDIPNPWYHEMQRLGYHYRITDIQCALALSQLKKLDRFIAKRRSAAAVYDNTFESFENMGPAQPADREHSGLHIYVVRIKFDQIQLSRAELMLKLRERGVGGQVHYIPVPAQPYYREMGFDPSNYPHAWKYYEEALSVPLYYSLTDEEQSKVIECFRELVG